MAKTTRNPPIVVLPANTKELESYQWHGTANTYLQAVVHGFGGIPLIVPTFIGTAEINALIQRVDGVLMTGGITNIHPERYGAPADPRAEPHDHARDNLALSLARAAVEHDLPLLAICRGVQELNVALGGSLISEVQDIDGRHDHRAPKSESRDVRFAIRQDVNIEPGGHLEEIFGPGTIRANSLHRQAIDRLGEGLVVEATAPDGTIEAVRVARSSTFSLGVQWHPEYWVKSDEPSIRLFAAFGKAVRKRMTRRKTPLAAAE